MSGHRMHRRGRMIDLATACLTVAAVLIVSPGLAQDQPQPSQPRPHAQQEQQQQPRQQQQQQPQQQQPQPQAAPATQPGATSRVQVGTYDPQVVFATYSGRQAFLERVQQIQDEVQQAQEAQDQEKLIQLQEEIQQAQLDVIEQFQSDIESVMPQVAQEVGVDIVVVEVAYSRAGIQPRDVTAQVVEQLARAQQPGATRELEGRSSDGAATQPATPQSTPPATPSQPESDAADTEQAPQ